VITIHHHRVPSFHSAGRQPQQAQEQHDPADENVATASVEYASMKIEEENHQKQQADGDGEGGHENDVLFGRMQFGRIVLIGQ